VCGAGAALWNGDVGSPDYPTVELRRYLTSSRRSEENFKKRFLTPFLITDTFSYHFRSPAIGVPVNALKVRRQWVHRYR